jgi:ATP synthase protein I
MREAANKSSLSRRGDELASRIQDRQQRMLRSRAERDRDFWHSVATLGVIGWSVVLPTLLGIAAGIWLDQRWPERFSWTLMLLTVGLTLGCVHAWGRIRRDSNKRGQGGR